MRVEIVKSPTGQRHAYIREGYRDRRGRPTKRTVEKLGAVADLEAADPEWRAKADARAGELAGAKAPATATVTVDLAAKADPVGALNLGWQLGGAVWDLAGLGPWLDRRRRDGGWGVDVAGILEALVACQIVWPSSKRAAVANLGRMLGAPEVSLAHAYRALDHIAELSGAIQSRARRALAGPGDRLECVFYDVTNYFFAIDQDDDADKADHNPARGAAARRRGACKEHRPEQIVQMGLFMDRAGLPVAYRLFHGSTPDCATLMGALAEFKAGFGEPHVTVVADAAMNSARNLIGLAGQDDDWVFAASIRKTNAKIRDWALEDTGWTYQIDRDGHLVSKTKSKTITRTVSYKTDGGTKVKQRVTEKVVARWTADYANRQRRKRAELAAKAAVLAGDPSAWRAASKRGAAKYVRLEQADPATGEVEESCPVLSLDEVKLEDDAALDGYWLLHTSRTGASDQELLADYAQLWQIEDAFRVTKTELRARPVYVRTPEHIEAHFAVCFLALLAARWLRNRLGMPVGQIADRMAELSVSDAADGYFLVNRTRAWDQIDRALGIDTDKKWATVTELRHWRRHMAAALRGEPLPT
jgi:transposase